MERCGAEITCPDNLTSNVHIHMKKETANALSPAGEGALAYSTELGRCLSERSSSTSTDRLADVGCRKIEVK